MPGSSHAALGHRFRIEGSGPGRALLDRLVDVLRQPEPEPPDATYELRLEDETATAFVAGTSAFAGQRGAVLSRLLTSINAAAAKSTPYLDVVHAAAVVHDGGAIVIPAASGQGKSTLCTALLAEGFGYMSDELAPIRDDLCVVPYPKPIVVGPLSFAVLEEFRACDIGGQPAQRWFLDPDRVARGSVAIEPAEISHVVIPRFEPGAPASLQPLSAGRVAAALVSNSFNMSTRRKDGLERLAAVAQGSRTLELFYGDARAAARLLADILSLRSM